MRRAREVFAAGLKITGSNPDDGSFKGMASVYGSVARGARGPTRFSEGAFRKTLAENKQGRYPLLWQHQDHLPIGTITLREGPEGLEADGKISRTALGADALTLLRDGAIDGLSIGFEAVRSTPEHHASGEQVRVVGEARLVECSLVTFPADRQARVRTVHAAARAFMDLCLDVPEEHRELVEDMLDLVVLAEGMGKCPDCGADGEAGGKCPDCGAAIPDPGHADAKAKKGPDAKKEPAPAEKYVDAKGRERHVGKVLSSANMARIQAAISALLDVVMAVGEDGQAFATGAVADRIPKPAAEMYVPDAQALRRRRDLLSAELELAAREAGMDPSAVAIIPGK